MRASSLLLESAATAAASAAAVETCNHLSTIQPLLSAIRKL
jgi:hypothetical protein